MHTSYSPQERAPGRHGASILGPSELLERLNVYKAKLRARPWPRKFYMVKADIKACFDTIDQNLLMRIAQTILGRVCHATDVLISDHLSFAPIH